MKESERIKLIQTIIDNAFVCAPENDEGLYWKGVAIGLDVVANEKTTEGETSVSE